MKEATKVSNQRGFMVLEFIIALAIGMFIMVVVYTILHSTLDDRAKQSRYNQFLADKDKLFLEVEDFLNRADSIEINNGETANVNYDMYDSARLNTDLTLMSNYTNAEGEYSEVLDIKDSSGKIISTRTIYRKGDGGTLQIHDVKKTVYDSLSDIYLEELNEVCYDENGIEVCKSITNLIDAVIYSSGVSGKSKEHVSRRLIYYD